MLTIRCDGKKIGTGTTGSRDVMYEGREFTAPFVRRMKPAAWDAAAREEAGQYVCEGSSPLYAELARIIGFERAAEIVGGLPADARTVTIRNECKY